MTYELNLKSDVWCNDDKIGEEIRDNLVDDAKELELDWLGFLDLDETLPPDVQEQAILEGNKFMNDNDINIQFKGVRISEFGNWDWLIK